LPGKGEGSCVDLDTRWFPWMLQIRKVMVIGHIGLTRPIACGDEFSKGALGLIRLHQEVDIAKCPGLAPGSDWCNKIPRAFDDQGHDASAIEVTQDVLQLRPLQFSSGEMGAIVLLQAQCYVTVTMVQSVRDRWQQCALGKGMDERRQQVLLSCQVNQRLPRKTAIHEAQAQSCNTCRVGIVLKNIPE
jgi:hypothetical protein